MSFCNPRQGKPTTGGLLAYYIPLIPFMYWMLAVLGWVTAVIGSLLAAL